MTTIRRGIVWLTACLAAVAVAAVLSVLTTSQLKAQKAKPKAQPSEHEAEVADLERRIAILESRAPFQVIGKDRKPIFEVQTDGTVNEATVFAGWHPVVSMGATQNGGYFTVEGTDRTGARMGSEGAWAGLRFEHVEYVDVHSGGSAKKPMNVPDLELGRMGAGNYVLKFPTQAGDVIAGIGESKGGSGLLVIGDSGGKKVAAMEIGKGNKGLVGIFAAGTSSPVAVMGEAFGNTGGSLVIGTEASEPRVKIGTADNRYGMVETLPASTVYVPRSGISGSYILGCAGGKECVH